MSTRGEKKNFFWKNWEKFDESEPYFQPRLRAKFIFFQNQTSHDDRIDPDGRGHVEIFKCDAVEKNFVIEWKFVVFIKIDIFYLFSLKFFPKSRKAADFC